MWVVSETKDIDLMINKAANRAKKAIMGPNRKKLIENANINASGQMAIRADLLAEETFLNSLIKSGLSGILFSEESGVKEFGYEPTGDNAIVLLLDPLDGSQNYKKGLSIGCISVAYGRYIKNPNLSHLDRATILNLYSEDLFFGVKDVGAWFNGETIEKNTNGAEGTELSQMSFYAYGEIAKKYFFDFQEKYSLRSLGSSAWELVLTTIGINDAYVDLRGVLRAHDYMAAKIIIESVGGIFKFIENDSDISKIKLNTFKVGYSVIASHHNYFVDILENDFKSHGLIS